VQLADRAAEQARGLGEGVVDAVDGLGVAVADVLEVHARREDELEGAVVQGL
jgi:hypothetical protein